MRWTCLDSNPVTGERIALAALAAGAGAVAWVTGKTLAFVDISMHRDPASMVILLAFMTMALAVVTTVGRNRSFALAAALSASVAIGALAVGYNGCYDSFRETVHRNVHNGVMAAVMEEGNGPAGSDLVEGWQGLSKEELSREFIRYRLGEDRSGGFVDYLALTSTSGFIHNRASAARGGSGAGHSAWRGLGGQFALTFALALLGIMPPTVLNRLRELKSAGGGYFLMPGIDMADVWTAMPPRWPVRTGGKAERPGRRHPASQGN